ncbi:MAG: ankyrin repeat domain-containing protein [Thiohalomonadales bacterium]
MNRKKTIQVSKVVALLIFIPCFSAFIYFSISILFPVYIFDDPRIAIDLTADKTEANKSRYKISGILLKYRFGDHFVMNPIYIAADKLYDRPQIYSICTQPNQEGFALTGGKSGSWFDAYGWGYSLQGSEHDRFISDIQNNMSIADVRIVKGRCTVANYKTNFLSKYDVYFELPRLATYEFPQLKAATYREAIKAQRERRLYDEGLTELTMAINNNCSECIDTLVAAGAAINGPSGPGKTPEYPERLEKSFVYEPLLYAMRQDKTKMVKRLIHLGAKTSLFYASYSGKCDYLALQLQSGADIHKPDKYGISPIAYAVKSGRLECVKLLVGRGADTNAVLGDGPMLHYAMYRGYFGIVKYLLQYGADRNIVDKDGETAYEISKYENLVKDSRIRKLFSRD